MDELDLLARALPDAAPPSPEVVARARARVAAGPRRRAGHPWALWAAAPATAVVVGVVFALVSNLTPAPVARPATAPNQALLDLADRVERLPELSGAYWRRSTVIGHRMPAGSYTLLVTSNSSYWHPRDATDPAMWTRHVSVAQPAAPADERAWRAAGSPARVKPDCPSGAKSEQCAPLPVNSEKKQDCTYGWNADPNDKLPGSPLNGLSLDELAELPAEPAALEKALRAHHRVLEQRGLMQPVETYVASATAALLDLPLRPGQRAATLRLLASLPGTKTYGTVKDPTGRPGLSVRVVDRKERTRYSGELVSIQSRHLLDPRTGMTLATVTSTDEARPGLPEGSVMVYGVFTGGWTDARPENPRGCVKER
ncbi:hypothetical protein SAMN05444920_104199 [Nonomuraea solani]|uniref:CU044_5270 family protein n=1 Tax=Nonomuraea solani TaxID=1144553 RepID=A0A1H6CQL3_9ACTN|nr:hypothetical protein [Nonomuraea solani]SEG74706.1 hypothetical protein SAMN05444920_104199 [Nonomuraea solani]